MRDSLLGRLQSWLVGRLAGGEVTTRTVRGVPVAVLNTREDIDTELVLRRLDAALALIERYRPWRFRHFRRDVRQIWVKRFACRGAYFPGERAVLTELTFLANPDFSEAQIAASILHEGVHARVHASGAHVPPEDKGREERLCRRAELDFGLAVPGGEPVVARALATLEMTDQEVAPAVDWAEAERRIREVDRGGRAGA